MNNGNAFPAAVKENKAGNSVASGWYPIASHQINITLSAGESKDFIFILGYSENPQDQKFVAPNVIRKDGAHKILEQFQTTEQVDAAFAELNAYWDKLLSASCRN